MIAEECARDLIDEGAVQVKGYYQHRNTWWDASDGKEASGPLKLELESCLSAKTPLNLA